MKESEGMDAEQMNKSKTKQQHINKTCGLLKDLV